jgi:transcription elongation factor Elf1
MSSRVIAVCDICGRQQEFKIGAPVDSYAWSRELTMEGWQQRTDDQEICQQHPRLVES